MEVMTDQLRVILQLFIDKLKNCKTDDDFKKTIAEIEEMKNSR